MVEVYPVRYNAGTCLTDNRADFPEVYDYGDKTTTSNFYEPNSRGKISLSVHLSYITNLGLSMSLCDLGITKKVPGDKKRLHVMSLLELQAYKS